VAVPDLRPCRRFPGILPIIAAVPLVLASLVGCGVVAGDQQPTPIPTSVVAEKPTYQVQRGDVILQTSLTGSVVPINPSVLSFKVDGRLKTLNVQVGDAVKKDAILAQLDIADLTQSLNAAQFTLDQDQVKLANSQKVTEFALRTAALELDVKQVALAKLQSTGASTYDLQIARDEVALAQVQVDELKSSVDTEAQGAVARDRTVVDQVNSDIEGRTIRAPNDGVVTTIAGKFQPGVTVTAFQTAIELGDPAQVEIAAELPPPASAFQIGQPATVSASRLPDKTANATLRKGEGSSGGDSSNPSPRFSFDNTVLQLKPGETADLSVVLARETNVLWLAPNGIRSFMGRTFVVLNDGGVEKRVDVELGTKTSDRVVVRQGLAEGQVVIGP
jgi:multidrug efflux pump subunit AcrA (membrane-fusion protein)